MKTLNQICQEAGSGPNEHVIRKVYCDLSKSKTPKYEAEIASDLESDISGCAANIKCYGSYIRTALDILESENIIKKNKARYSIK